MRIVFTYSLLLALMLHAFSPLAIIADYLVNKEYIAANDCENRDEPELNCAGTCQLVKALKKDKEQKQEGSITKVDVLLFLSPKPLTEIQQTVVLSNQEQPVFIAEPAILSGVHSGIFHPPAIQA